MQVYVQPPIEETVSMSISPLIAEDTLNIIFNFIVNQTNSRSLIPSFALTCKAWKEMSQRHPGILVAQALLDVRDQKVPLPVFTGTYCKTWLENDFSNLEWKMIDHTYHLSPESFHTLLNSLSGLFQKGSLCCALLNRYSWVIEDCENSQDADIRKIAANQLAILKSFVKVKSNEERLEALRKNFPKLYLKGQSRLLGPQSKTCILSILDKLEKSKDRQLLMQIKAYYQISAEVIPESFMKDREFVLMMVQQDGASLEYLSNSFQKDREIVLAAVKQDRSALDFVPESLMKDREIVLAMVQKDGARLEYLSKSFQKDRKIVLAAVKENGFALKYADESLQQDRKIVLAAIKQFACAFTLASKTLQQDRKIVLAAVKQDGLVLEFADASLQQDRKIVLAAVKQNGLALEFADVSLQQDRKVVLAAVKQNGLALEFADVSLQQDRKVVLAAVKQDGDALEFADASLQKDQQMIILAAIE